MILGAGRWASSGPTRTATPNKRVAGVCHQWAFAAINASPGARAFYDQRRTCDTHHRAQRAFGNRLVGTLHGCCDTLYNEHTAWGHRTAAAA